jgi:hypothetical protein
MQNPGLENLWQRVKSAELGITKSEMVGGQK